MGERQEPLTESYFYILLCLYEQPRHGYGIMQRVRELSEGHVRIGSGTMYGATANLMNKGWIEEYDAPERGDERRRFYRLTPLGEQALQNECRRLQHLAKAARRVTVDAERSEL